MLVKQEQKNTERNIIDSTFDTTSRHCYNISVTDKCGIEGKRGRAHCPIQLTGESTVPRQVTLYWTYYVGWANVEKYEIYRKEIDSSFKYVGEVFNTQKTHIDSNNVCSQPYFYRVAAKYPGSEVRAFSNWIFVNPTVDFNPNKPDLKNVSVVGFEEIEVKWHPSTYRFNTQYMITRAEATPNNVVDSFFTPALSYIDSFVTPQLYPYFYRVHEVDNCYNISASGRFSKTIFLDGNNKSGVSEIGWTPYNHWDYPTTEHHIEFLPLNGRQYLGKVEPSVFTYKDNGFYEDVDGYYRYQIHSINSNLDTSYSNVAYISGSGIYYLQNSFSPNNDGLNDEFNFYTLFITNNINESESDYEVEIYNRWGQIVFYSNDLTKKWNGTYNGGPAPAGVYLYRIKLMDGDRTKTNLGGTLHLIR
jgi:gliding motility-associated-like protein